MGPDEVPNPRRRCLELSGGAFADKVEVSEQTPSLAIVDIQCADIFVDEGYQPRVASLGGKVGQSDETDPPNHLTFPFITSATVISSHSSSTFFAVYSSGGGGTSGKQFLIFFNFLGR